MLSLEGWLIPRYGNTIPDVYWQLADPLALVIIKIPALYLLVFLPMQKLHQEREQRAIDLHQAALREIEKDEKLLAQHHLALESQERMIRLEKLSSMGTMVGGVAHEINNPLMGIMNYVEYARDKSTDKKTQEVLDNALHEINRIKKIVSNMLIFIRTDSAQQASCNPQAVIQQTLNLLDGEFTKSSIQVDTQLPADLPNIQCGAGSLQQVLVNLLLNSRDAITGGIPARIMIKGHSERGQVNLFICDNGAGIPPENLEKIFDPFFTTKPAGKGTGLGLSVSQHLVNEVGGSISLQKEQGFGCCFRLTFATA